jgi:hypothetical protein
MAPGGRFAKLPPALTTTLVLLVVSTVVLSAWAVQTSRAAISTADQSSVRDSLTREANLSNSPLLLSYINSGNGGSELPPVVATGALNLSGQLFLLSGSLYKAAFIAASNTLELSGASYADADVCTPTLALSQASYGPITFVEGARIFGPSTVSVNLAGSSEWPSIGQGLILPRPSGAQTSNTSTLLSIVMNGTDRARLDFTQLTTQSNQTLEGESPSFVFDPSRASVLTVGFSGTGGFVAQVNGETVLNGTIPGFDAEPQQVGAWTNSSSNVLGVYVLANGQTAYFGSTANCGSLLLFPMLSASVPKVVQPSAGAYIIGPLTGGAAGGPERFLLEQLIPYGDPEIAATVSGAAPVDLGPGSLFSASFAPSLGG